MSTRNRFSTFVAKNRLGQPSWVKSFVEVRLRALPILRRRWRSAMYSRRHAPLCWLPTPLLGWRRAPLARRHVFSVRRRLQHALQSLSSKKHDARVQLLMVLVATPRVWFLLAALVTARLVVPLPAVLRDAAGAARRRGMTRRLT